MRNRVPDEATCAICGRHFDPSETRGWCPNPSCGEWQHPSFPIDGGPEETEPAGETEADSGASGPTKTCPDCGNEVRVDANFCKHCAHAFDDEEEPPVETPSDGEGADELPCPDCGFDLSDIPTDQLSICPVCMYDVTPMLEEADAEAEAARDELTVCPNCGEDLSAIPSELRTVCPGCRIDLEEAVAGDGEVTEPPSAGEPAEPDEPSAEEPAEPDAPSAEEPPEPDAQTVPGDETGGRQSAPIETVDAVESGYGPRLEEAGVATLGDLLRADPDDLSTKTGISARRIRGWVEETGVEPAEPAHDPTEFVDERELVLEVMGREVSVVDGQTVGSEIRSAMVEAGASEEDAVYVHRKHVRIDAADGEFFLTRLGENNLEVNGQPVEKGHRVPIGDGDEITFSDVVDVTVTVQ